MSNCYFVKYDHHYYRKKTLKNLFFFLRKVYYKGQSGSKHFHELIEVNLYVCVPV